MASKLDGLWKSFRFAARGFCYCLRRERNFRIHLVAAAYAFALAFGLHLDRRQFALLALTAACVLAAEMINTAVEAAVDLISPERHPLAAAAKDAAAGAVLVFAAASLVVGFSIFWMPFELLELAERILTTPWAFILLAGSAGLSAWFVFGVGEWKPPTEG